MDLTGKRFRFSRTVPQKRRDELASMGFPRGTGCTVEFHTGNCVKTPQGEWLQISNPVTGEVGYASLSELAVS